MNTYLCYGDSLTYGYNPATGGKYPTGSWVDYLNQFSSYTFINLGVCGRTIPDFAPLSLTPASGRYLWIMLGSNDLLDGLTAEEVGQRMEDFIESLLSEPTRQQDRNRSKNIWQPQDIRLIAPVAFKPGTWVESEKLITESHRLRDIYLSIAEKLKISFTPATNWNIPLQFDGVHFTSEGHRIYAEKMRYAGILT